MKACLITVSLALAACAAGPGKSTLDSRLSSWSGAPISELVSVLDEPISVSEDWFIWSKTGPGMRSARSVNVLSHPAVLSCVGCDPNSSASLAPPSRLEMDARGGNGTSVSRRECIYSALVEDSIVKELKVSEVSGRCDFNDIPFRDQ